MHVFEKNIKDLDLIIPVTAIPLANYVPFKIIDNFLYISGQTPSKNGKIIFKGKIDNKNKDYGYKAAQLCAVNIIGQVNSAVNGDFNQVSKCINLGGFVNSKNNFEDHAYVINGASDLLGNIFKIKGIHYLFFSSLSPCKIWYAW